MVTKVGRVIRGVGGFVGVGSGGKTGVKGYKEATERADYKTTMSLPSQPEGSSKILLPGGKIGYINPSPSPDSGGGGGISVSIVPSGNIQEELRKTSPEELKVTKQNVVTQASLRDSVQRDKFGRTSDYYTNVKNERDKRTSERESLNKANNFVSAISDYYQKQYDAGKISYSEGNKRINKEIETYNKAQQEQYLNEQGIKKLYDKPQENYYDPNTGKLIDQSVEPSVAKERGLIKVSVIGESTSGGKIVESESGLLTEKQLANKELIERVGFEKSEIPTTVVVGGKSSGKNSYFNQSSYELSQIEAPKKEIGKEVRFGFFNYETKKRITSPFGYLGGQVSAIAEATGKGVENLYFNINKGEIGKTRTLYQEQYGTQQYVGMQPVKFYKGEEYTVKEEDVRSAAKTFGKVTEFGIKGGAYFVPVLGTTLFATEGADIGTTAIKEKRAFGTVSQETKREALFFGGAVATAGALKGVKYLRNPIIKEVEGGFKVTSRWNEIAGKRIIFSTAPENTFGIQTKYLPSNRGRYFTFEKLEAPVTNIKASGTLGGDLGKNVIYKKQVLEKIGTEGRITTVKEYNKGKIKELYSGNPYVDKLGYKKQYEYLKGLFGESYAKNVLRYSAPKIQRQTLKEGVINLMDKSAKGEFIFMSDRPIVIVDKTRGIKTRGGKGIKTTIYVNRKSIGQAGRFGISLEESSSILRNIGKEKNVFDLKGFDFERGVNVGFSRGKKKLIRSVDLNFEKIGSVSARGYVPFDNVIRLEGGETYLLSAAKAEERLGSVIKSGSKKSSKEYLQELYSPEIVAAPKAPKIKISESPKQIKIQKVEQTTFQNTIPGSAYAGTGMYELTEVQTIPQTIISVNPQQSRIKISTQIEPQVYENKQIKLIKEQPLIKVGELNKQLNLLREQELIKQGKLLKENVLVRNKQLTKQKEILKQKQVELLKSRLDTKQIQKISELLKTKQTNRPREKTFEFKLPKIPIPKLPVSSTPKEFKQAVSGNGFEAVGFKFGKQVSVGFGTKEEAAQTLKGFLKKELSASGFVRSKETGEKVSFGELADIFGSEFRPGKKSSTLIVEKQSKRLRSGGGTGKSIQFFRKKR